MSYILGTLNLVLMLAMIFTFKNVGAELGGTIALFAIVPVLLFLSVWFKRLSLQLNLLSLGLFVVFAWQYLLYLETTRTFSNNIILALFLVTVLMIFAIQIIIVAKSILSHNQSQEQKTKTKIAKSILMKLYLYSFAGLSFAYLFGLAVGFSQQTYLVRQTVITTIAVGLFWAVLANIASIVTIGRVNEKYLRFVYIRQSLDISKLKKITLSAFTILLLIGFLLEAMTRKRLVVYLETYLFILSAMVLIWKIVRFESHNDPDQNMSDQAINSSVMPSLNFYLKYIFAFAVGGTLAFVMFMLLLRSVPSP